MYPKRYLFLYLKRHTYKFNNNIFVLILRHVDCSTQFFVLLQPAKWMLSKYVAFGQLVDGEKTLRKIEKVDTRHEAPTKMISIVDAGILSMNSHGTTDQAKVSTLEYINSHIEDLVSLGNSLMDVRSFYFCPRSYRGKADTGER